VMASSLGAAKSELELEALLEVPGPIELETVVGANWEVPLEGLLNLDHPEAKRAGLADHPEPIVVMFHAVRHPRAGLYLVDTGVERAIRDDPPSAALGTGIVARAFHVEKMHVLKDTAAWIAVQNDPVRGVFLTHLHTDHVSGMRDVPNAVAVYSGPGDAASSSLQNLFVQPVINKALEGKASIQEWTFTQAASGAFEGIVDVFGDGTFWALWVPGHTPGSTAYLARTPKGAVLFTGDACHTLWGWDHRVEPGTYSDDKPRSAKSLAALHALVARHPSIEVRVGHQLRR
jgi:N-acyl homoserine lactone hydrolase